MDDGVETVDEKESSDSHEQVDEMIVEAPSLGRQRTVSFDVSTQLPPTEPKRNNIPPTSSVSATGTSTKPTGESISSKPPRQPKTKNVSLKNVTESTPREDEAETYIQKSIQDQLVKDSARGTANSSVRSILGGFEPVHHESVRGMTGGADDAGSNRSRAPQADQPLDHRGHRRAPSAAETLANLQQEMAKIQDPALMGGGGEGNDYSNVPGEGNGTSADLFATNAIKLMQRNRAQKKESDSAGGTDGKDGSQRLFADPEVGWARLRQAVQTGEYEDSKKTDVPPTQPVPTDGDNEPETPVEEGSNLVRESEHVDIPGNKHAYKTRFTSLRGDLRDDWYDFEMWAKLKRRGACYYFRIVFAFLILPLIGTAAILFYAFDNPPCGTQAECDAALESLTAQPTSAPTMENATDTEGNGLEGIAEFFNSGDDFTTSVSYWLLFTARQIITLSMTFVVQAFVVDFLALRTRVAFRLCGPYATLWTVQSRGWPFVITCWGILDFALLYGQHSFARHWLHFQSSVSLFNKDNPSGNLTAEVPYRTLLLLGVCIGLAVTTKRFWLGLYLGRQTFARYATDLTSVFKKVVLVGQVASLARDMDVYGYDLDDFDIDNDVYDRAVNAGDNESTRAPQKQKSQAALRSDLNTSQRAKVNDLLGSWEEPDLVESDQYDEINIGSIIQFRRSLQKLSTDYPFSVSFGLADTRENCIQSAEWLYSRLLRATPGETNLNFDVLALLAVKSDGNLNEALLRDVVRLFRPERDGTLTLLDFAKSIDTVYKELRILRASVANASRLDRAFEKIFNTVFYIILGCIVLSVMSVDPLVLFASVSGFIIGFSFMVGAAASKYFEGILLILLRHPFDVGDRVAISNVNNDTSASGSATWFVKDVTLFTTTVVYAATNEVATYSNGSLANSRIINAARSPQAVLHFLLKFPINTPYAKLKVFRAALEKFMKDRPREWLSFAAFRATRVEADAGFVEYIVVGQHREGWQNMGALLSSKAEVSSFALELSKRMGMRYIAPALPVDLNVKSGSLASLGLADETSRSRAESTEVRSQQDPYSSLDIEALEAMFRREA